jgi:hypothetical protein
MPVALSREIILVGVFLLGTGFAFLAPIASASIPEIVGKEQLPSAIELGCNYPVTSEQGLRNGYEDLTVSARHLLI